MSSFVEYLEHFLVLNCRNLLKSLFLDSWASSDIWPIGRIVEFKTSFPWTKILCTDEGIKNHSYSLIKILAVSREKDSNFAGSTLFPHDRTCKSIKNRWISSSFTSVILATAFQLRKNRRAVFPSLELPELCLYSWNIHSYAKFSFQYWLNFVFRFLHDDFFFWSPCAPLFKFKAIRYV